MISEIERLLDSYADALECCADEGIVNARAWEVVEALGRDMVLPWTEPSGKGIAPHDVYRELLLPGDRGETIACISNGWATRDPDGTWDWTALDEAGNESGFEDARRACDASLRAQGFRLVGERREG